MKNKKPVLNQSIDILQNSEFFNADQTRTMRTMMPGVFAILQMIG